MMHSPGLKILGMAFLALTLSHCSDGSGGRSSPDPSQQQLVVPPNQRHGTKPDSLPGSKTKDSHESSPDVPVPSAEDTLLPRMA